MAEADTATGEVQHATVGIDIKMRPFVPAAETDETARLWQKWRKELVTRFRYFRITACQDQIDALDIYGGEHIRELLETLPDVQPNIVTLAGQQQPNQGAEELNMFEKQLAKLDNHYKPMLNTDSGRSKFDKMYQLDAETVAQYYVRLRMQGLKCGFPDMDDALRSKLLQTIRDNKLRRSAMVNRYTLSQLLENAAVKEGIESQAQAIENNIKMANSNEVKRVHEQKQYAKQRKSSFNFKETQNTNESKVCLYCGTNHYGPRTNCPASGKKCNVCSKIGHFARMCKNKIGEKYSNTNKHSTEKSHKNAPRKSWSNTKAYHVAKGQENDSGDSDFTFSMNNVQNNGKSAPTIKIKLNGVKGLVDVDSCSTANIIDEYKFDLVQKASQQQIVVKPTATKLYAFAQKEPIPLIGCFEGIVESLSTGQSTTAQFLVVKGSTSSRPLLSLNTSLQLGVLHLTHTTNVTGKWNVNAQNQIKVGGDDTIDGMINEYQDVFEGLGKHKTIKAKLIIDDTVTPVAHKRRKIPYNLEKKAHLEEERLKEMGVIENVPDNQPTTWCTNPVIAPKPRNPDSIRYCSDMRVPNTAIGRPVTEPLTVEDIKFKLNGATVYSVLDMNEGYHQLELDEESRHLTTFHGINNKMRYTRLNYGTISAQDIFDKAMDDTIDGLHGVLHIRDDFIVYGKDEAEHNNAMKSLLHKFRECGLTFNRKKCKFHVPRIEFFGFVFSKEGISPSSSKVDALKSMEAPKNASEVRSLLGMAQYSMQFIPNFSEITAPLRKLTHKSNNWQWTGIEQNAFEMLKHVLCEDTVLGYYEVGLETKLVVDAGPNGLGLMLLQKTAQGWKPVVCASRSLTAVESRYSQTEREALSIRWACERCYMYLIGSTFTVETDHQPLLPLFNNPNSRPPMRIERWILYMQQFDYVLTYRPGKDNAADYLSRHACPLTSRNRLDSQYRENTVHTIIQDTVPKAIGLSELKAETQKDSAMKTLITYIQSGNNRDCKEDRDTRKYMHVFSELSYIEDLVMRGDRIVIPDSLQDQVIDICHEGHLGIVKTKQLLRSKIWFPGIDKSVEAKIANCIPCQANTAKSQRDPIRTSQLPKGPWVNASADFYGPLPTGELLLVVIDAYSRYPEVEIVPSTSAQCSIPAFEKIFATHGIPELIKTDNGPPFNGHVFTEFAQEKGFFHHRVTPLWPEANGQAENFMKNISKIVRLSHASGKDWKRELYTFLGNYRSVPHPGTGKSPYELCMHRHVRSKVPSVIIATPDKSVREKDDRSKARMKAYADKTRNTKTHVLQIGDTVLVKQRRRNKTCSLYEPTIYTVEDINRSVVTAKRLSDGRRITRNSSFFKRVNVSAKDYEKYTTTPQLQDDMDYENIDYSAVPEVNLPVNDKPIDLVIAADNLQAPDVRGVPAGESRSRYGRLCRKPAWQSDYIE